MSKDIATRLATRVTPSLRPEVCARKRLRSQGRWLGSLGRVWMMVVMVGMVVNNPQGLIIWVLGRRNKWDRHRGRGCSGQERVGDCRLLLDDMLLLLWVRRPKV